MNRILCDAKAEVVRAPVNQTGLHPAARNQDRERVAVMVAAWSPYYSIPAIGLHHRSAPELSGKDNDRFVEKAALFKIFDQCRYRLVDLSALPRKLLLEERVVIPV